MEKEHQLVAEQNKPARIELLRAQRLFYARAKLCQNSFTILALVLPAVGLLFGASFPQIRPYLGVGSIVVLLLEVGLFSRMQRADCKRGAKVQEQFDTEVLRLDWNRLVAGSKVDAEEIRDITSSPATAAELNNLKNWYEPVINELPLSVGRLICQRTNLAYDLRVRRRYASLLLWSAVALFIGLTGIGLYQGLTVNDLILTMVLPLLPFAAFALREQRKQGDTIETLETLKAEVEKLWEKALGGASSAELTFGSRAIQDAIFRHRASAPLVVDWLYGRLRKKEENVTHHAAQQLVETAKQKLKI